MYSEVFCKVYNELGWNYYPEIFGEHLLRWLKENDVSVKTALDIGCGTGVLCEILDGQGIAASGMDYSAGMIQIARSRNSKIAYEVADMITYRPEKTYDLVTCTGDALNHIPDMEDVKKIFSNVFAYTAPGGHFIFDVLNEKEVSTGEPFEMDFTDTTSVRFQMTRPEERTVNLNICVYENGALQLEENIRETIHDPQKICELLRNCGFTVLRCGDRLLEDAGHGTTWFVVARKGVGG